MNKEFEVEANETLYLFHQDMIGQFNTHFKYSDDISNLASEELKDAFNNDPEE